MRTLFMLTFVVSVVVTLASLMVLPSEVAMNFGGDGLPNSWGSKYVYVSIFLFMLSLVFVLCFVTPSLTMKLPPRLVNLPNKAYWLHDANKSAVRDKLESLMSEFGFALVLCMLCMLCVKLLVLKAHAADPVQLDNGPFFVVVIGFTVYTVYWCLKMVRSFKVPT